MSNFIDGVLTKPLNRRNFLKGSAAGVAALTLPGCGNKLVSTSSDKLTDAENQGKWVTASCWEDCGGRCLNKALVVDGMVLRQKTDDTHPDSPDFPQERGCLRGRSRRKEILGADRLKYPMKRKHWQPGGGDKSLRGKDEWERISWDEALDYIANELKTAKQNYGNRSIYCASRWWDTYGGGEVTHVLNLFGGFVNNWSANSAGSWEFTQPSMGYGARKSPTINDRMDLRNCETIIMLSMNPAWSTGGNGSYYFMQAKKAGAKFICIDPFYNDSYAAFDAEWIPVRPGTDMALLLATVYSMLEQDDPITNPLIDWDFLHRYTLGFDSDHMPKGADPSDNLKDYVLGKKDGIPKTPEWASEICGVPPEQIFQLAREFRKDKKVAFLAGWASARTHNSDNLPQIVMTLGAMGGHIGKSGHMTGTSCQKKSGNDGPDLVKKGVTNLPKVPDAIDDCIHDSKIWDAVLTGKYHWTGRGQWMATEPGEERDIDIHVIYHAGRQLLQNRQNMMKGIEAHRKVDFVVSHAYFLNTNATYSDIVLPVTTEWERIGGILNGRRENIIVHTGVIKPLYEAKDDRWIAIELAKRLGIDPTEIYPFDEKQQFFNTLATSKVIKGDGKTYGPLLTITSEDIKAWGVEGRPQKGVITLNEFLERGIYQVERKPGDNLGHISFKKFIDDPENNPLSSESGKLEIYCQQLADTVTAMGFSKVTPIPTYTPIIEGYEATFTDRDKKVKGEYPFQIVTPKYLKRSHASLDNVAQLSEAFTSPVFINSKDAEKSGIADGDTVLIHNQNGRILRHANVSDRVVPGVLVLPHGTWADLDEVEGVDRGGADNMLTSPTVSGQGISGYNSCLVDIEKYNGKSIPEDSHRKQRIVL